MVKTRGFLDSFTLKVIAIIGMTFNHIAHVFGAHLPSAAYTLFILVGGLTFPIMAYSMVEGYRKTSNLKRYMLRLFIAGMIALLPFMWALKTQTLNVMFTLLLGLICLHLYHTMTSRTGFWLVFSSLTLLSLFFCDWGGIGIPLVVMCGMTAGEKKRVVLPITIISIIGVAMQVVPVIIMRSATGLAYPFSKDMVFFIGCMAAIPLLLAYNGQRGRPIKLLFYAYYPAHLLVLALLRWLFMHY